MTQTPEANQLITNHNVRIVTLTTGERVLTIFAEVRTEDEENRVVGYRLIYPYTLSLGVANEDGTMPITYERWCPFSPVEEHRISGEHIISVVFPDNNILNNYTEKLADYGVKKENIFFPEEQKDGDTSEPTETVEPVVDSAG
tara:strand:+ start:71 stop:499 length:429 start_codon:yes stop_codon:yes gene_type:complete